MERSSFFNAELKGEEYDRVYLAEDYARYFASFIGNGVFPTPSTNLHVTADGTTMNLTLKQGKAWINGYFYENTEDLILSIDVADGVLNRIDRVVVRLDFINREIKTYIKKGTFASSPVAPSLVRNADMYELGIADIKINKGVTKIVQADITDLRQNNNYCGLVAGIVQQIDTTNLFAQFQSTFDIWFEHIKGQLAEDAAGNLQLQIDTWNDFKVNGGTVGGDIKLRQKMFSSTLFLELLTASGFGITIDENGGRIVPKTNKNIDLGSELYRFKDLWLGDYSKSVNGYDRLPNGFLMQWIEVDVNFATAQAQDISITMPIGFVSGGAFGFANCITNSTSAKYTTAAVTTTNSLTGSFLLRAATTQSINSTLRFKVFAIGY